MVRMKYSGQPSNPTNSGYTDLNILSPNDPIAKAVNLTLSGASQDFPVVELGKIVGVLRKDDLMDTLSRGDINFLVKDVMRTDLK